MPLTKKGALLITNDLDRLATVIAAEKETLGIPDKVAAGFSEWCDRLSDRIERHAGINPQNKAAELKLALSGQTDHKTDYPFDAGKTHDAEQIGEEVSGPQEGDADESAYMGGEFTQQENRELREKQESGGLAGVNTDPRGPRPGVQAAVEALTAATKDASYSDEVAAKVAEAITLAADIAKSAKSAKSADDDEDEDDKGEDDKEAKAAGYGHGYNLNA